MFDEGAKVDGLYILTHGLIKVTRLGVDGHQQLIVILGQGNIVGEMSLCDDRPPPDTVIARHRKRLKARARRITIDLDPTDDLIYGAQQLTFFNKHYDIWCYLPVACLLQFNDEADQYAFGYVLRPGDATAHYGAIGILKRTIVKLRKAFGKVKIRVRLDGKFCFSGNASMVTVELHLKIKFAIAPDTVSNYELKVPLREKEEKPRACPTTVTDAITRRTVSSQRRYVTRKLSKHSLCDGLNRPSLEYLRRPYSYAARS